VNMPRKHESPPKKSSEKNAIG